MLIDTIIKLKSRCCLEEEIGEDFNLTSKELACIFNLKDNEAIHSKDLSGKINLSPSRGSRVINNLIKKGFLIEIHDQKDKRYSNISLSKKGNVIFKKVEEKKFECENRLLAKLDSHQREVVKEGLNILLEVL